MTAVTLKIHDQAVAAALQALADRVARPAAKLQEIGEGILSRADARFDAETGPDGVKWKPKKHKDGRKTLAGESGLLRQQIVADATDSVLTVHTTSVTQEYAAIHQFGGTVQRKAGEITTRHRTDAKGQLLRSKIMSGKGLIFANSRHKRVLERTWSHAAYTIHIPARPFLPVRADGSLYPDEQGQVVGQIDEWLLGRLAG